MSRMATSEYIGAKRRAYAQADRARRTRILGEARLDSPALQDDHLMKLCDNWLGFRNVLCPCKMLVSREKRPDGKGCRCRYDKPPDSVPEGCRRTRSVIGAGSRAKGAQGPAQQNGPLQAGSQAPAQDSAHEPRRGAKIECPVFGKPKTTKLSTERPFYLTNWDSQRARHSVRPV